MPEHNEHPEKRQKPDKATLAGAQGNTGQYGQGQYDSDGKPDPHGPQAEQLHTDEQPQSAKSPQLRPAKNSSNHPEVPQD